MATDLKPAFLSIRKASMTLGIHESNVRQLIADGRLDPVDIKLDGRGARYVTTSSVEAFIAKARAAGDAARQRCSRCKGFRHLRPGTSHCGPCADRLAEKAAVQADRRRQRKREWWQANGRQWRAGRRAASRSAVSTAPPPTEGETTDV